MVDHAALVPSFRDFSEDRRTMQILLGKEPVSHEPVEQAPLPTVIEVERALRESPAGKIGMAVDTSSWPKFEEMGFLEAAVPGIKVHGFGGVAPFQADGIWGPYEWYYRERGGGSRLTLAPIGTFPSGHSGGLYTAYGAVEEFAGSGGWVSRFLRHWERLERSPFLYDFPSKELTFEDEPVPTGKTIQPPGWGFSPTDAWLNTAGYSSYLDEKLGWTREFQEKRRELMEISKEPSNQDERVYPLEDPDFSVDWDALVFPEGFEGYREG